MVELRRFIDELRDKPGVPYPLADRRPLISFRDLVYDAQTAAGLGAEYCLVSVMDQQLMLTPPGDAFLSRLDFDGDLLVGYRPDPDPESPVRIMPDVRFSRPSIKGISTEAIWEQAEVGEDVETLAEVYRLDVGDVRWALAYENRQHAV